MESDYEEIISYNDQKIKKKNMNDLLRLFVYPNIRGGFSKAAKKYVKFNQFDVDFYANADKATYINTVFPALDNLVVSAEHNTPLSLYLDEVYNGDYSHEHENNQDYIHYRMYWEMSGIYTMLKFNNCAFPINRINWDANDFTLSHSIKNFNKRFVVYKIALYTLKTYSGEVLTETQCHANVIFIDNAQKTIIWYEPSGNFEQSLNYERDSLRESLNETLRDTDFAGYTFIENYGFQEYDFIPDLCERWCAAYAFLRVKFGDTDHKINWVIAKKMPQFFTPIHFKIWNNFGSENLRLIVYKHLIAIRKLYEQLIEICFFQNNFQQFGIGTIIQLLSTILCNKIS